MKFAKTRKTRADIFRQHHFVIRTKSICRNKKNYVLCSFNYIRHNFSCMGHSFSYILCSFLGVWEKLPVSVLRELYERCMLFIDRIRYICRGVLHTPCMPPHKPHRKPPSNFAKSAQFRAYAIRPYKSRKSLKQKNGALRH